MAARYHDAVTSGAEKLIGPAAWTASTARRRTAHRPHRGARLAHAALPPRARALDGHDPLELLRNAVAAGWLADARDPAAVLDARIDDGLRAGPLPWLPAIPTALERTGTGAATSGPAATG